MSPGLRVSPVPPSTAVSAATAVSAVTAGYNSLTLVTSLAPHSSLPAPHSARRSPLLFILNLYQPALFVLRSALSPPPLISSSSKLRLRHQQPPGCDTSKQQSGNGFPESEQSPGSEREYRVKQNAGYPDLPEDIAAEYSERGQSSRQLRQSRQYLCLTGPLE